MHFYDYGGRDMQQPKEINANGPMPFIGSMLESQKKEVIMAAIIKAAQENNVWGHIRPKKVMNILPEYTVYNLGPQTIWNAFHELVNAKLLITGTDDGGDYVEVTEEVIHLTTSKL